MSASDKSLGHAHLREQNETFEDVPVRFVIFHLHPVSARLRFLKSRSQHLCLPSPLPKLSELIVKAKKDAKIAAHPSSYLQACCKSWKIPETHLTIVPDFRLWVDTPKAEIPVYVLHLDTHQPFEPPLELVWIELPVCFDLTSVERQIMQEIYRWLLE
jgi:hypothetical protein